MKHYKPEKICTENKCLFIIPYFGKFPSTFPYWLKCCRNNPEFYFLILTDNTPYDLNIPSNVKIISCTLKELAQKISEKLNTHINIKRPYKLCDFRPLYGYIFSDELKNYSHWGYCDLDILFGRLPNFLTDELLNEYDKINVLGHMSIYKNIEEVNSVFCGGGGDNRNIKRSQMQMFR